MAYQTLYRKYRSQTFDDVVGQAHVVRTIRNAIKSGRIGHGYLFCGSRGTGKTTVARLIAKALNCLNGGPTPDPCGKCEACVAIAEGNAVDVVEMDAASNRGIEHIEALRDTVKYPPMHLKYKVYIIDEAHQLTLQAKDAFLKTLEEPPSHTVFILATTEAHKIPITIRSRCQQFDFRRGSLEEISGRLKYVVESEGASIDDDALELIARSANGSFRDSLSLLEQVLAYAEGKVTAQDVYTVIGSIEEDALLEIANSIASGSAAKVFTLADTLIREGRDVKELLKSCAAHFRDILAVKLGADKSRADKPEWKKLAESFDSNSLLKIIEVFANAEGELRWNDQHRLALEMALLKAMQVNTAQSEFDRPATPISQFQSPREKTVLVAAQQENAVDKISVSKFEPVVKDEKNVFEADNSSVTDDNSSEISIEKARAAWKRMLARLESQKKLSDLAIAKRGMPIDVKNDKIYVEFSKQNPFHIAKFKESPQKYEEILSEFLGSKVQCLVVVADKSSATTYDGERTDESLSSEQSQLQEIIDKFGGIIVEGKKYPGED